MGGTSAGGIADIWLEIRVNGIPLSDLSGMQLRIDLKRLLEEKNSFLCAEPEGRRRSGTAAGFGGCGGGQGAAKLLSSQAQSWCLRGATGGTPRVEERAVRFEDVPESFWGAGDIVFAAARELLQGTGPAEFSRRNT